MYDEIKVQRETIKRLEKQILSLKNNSSSIISLKEELSNQKRYPGERSVSVSHMAERSSSPLINIPRLDLSKVLPYEKP
jgi:hypothetical protein